MTADEGHVEVADEFIRIRTSLEGTINRRVRSMDVAADLASDMYVKLLRLRPRANTTREAWSYLHRMAGSIAIDYARGQQRRQKILAEAASLIEPEPEPDPETTVLAANEMQVVEAALRELPAKCRDVLILSRVHGLTHREIAKQLGVSQSLVEKYLIRTMRHCRDRLRETRDHAEPGDAR